MKKSLFIPNRTHSFPSFIYSVVCGLICQSPYCGTNTCIITIFRFHFILKYFYSLCLVLFWNNGIFFNQNSASSQKYSIIGPQYSAESESITQMTVKLFSCIIIVRYIYVNICIKTVSDSDTLVLHVSEQDFYVLFGFIVSSYDSFFI